MNKNLRIDSAAWDAGFAAGEAGKVGCPYKAGTTEAWSWHSGFIEGDAKRQGYSYSRGCADSPSGLR